MNLQQRWVSLPWSVRNRERVKQMFSIFLSCYGLLGRVYHGLRHLEECLQEFDSVKRTARNPFAVELALWYHDVVYDTKPPLSGWNEAASAGLAVDHLSELGFPGDFVYKVAKLVLATRHDKLLVDNDEQLIADIDIAIFGKPKGWVDEYEAGIWEEYSWAKGTAAGRQKRAEILKGFLDRDSVYYTEIFRLRYEKQARESLKRLLQANS